MTIKLLHKLKITSFFCIPKVNAALHMICGKLQMYIVKHFQKDIYGLTGDKREPEVVVSLTTYEDRIGIIHYTLRTLLNQTYKPNRIIVWLARDAFSDDNIPDELMKLKDYGVEILYCDELRSHKKYYEAMKRFPESIIITFDDDVIYPEDQIEKLMKTWKKYPDCIVANETKQLRFDDDYNLLYDYKNSISLSNFGMKPDFMLLPIGCGGVLYPPGSLHKDVFDVEKIKTLAYTADDLWLKAMSIKKGTKAVKTERWGRYLNCIENSQKSSLATINCNGGGNEKVMEAILNAYPELKKIIDACD